MINAKQILKYALEGKFANSEHKFITELLQNSRRAGASRVDIKYKGNKLTYQDNGKGVVDWDSVIVLGSSGWDNDIKETEDPAGFGLYSLYAISEVVKIGEVSFQPIKLIDDEYSQKILKLLNDAPKKSGFYLEAITKKPVEDLLRWFDIGSLGYFPMEIYINNEQVERITPEKIKSKNKYLEFTYGGDKNVVLIPYDMIPLHLEFPDDGTMNLNLTVIYHGEFIETNRIRYGNGMFFFINEGRPLDINLPFRDNVIKNNKLKNFNAYIAEKIKEYVDSIDFEKYNLEVGEHYSDNEYDKELSFIKNILINDSTERRGIVIELYIDEYDYPEKFIIVTKPTKREEIEKIIGTKIAKWSTGDMIYTNLLIRTYGSDKAVKRFIPDIPIVKLPKINKKNRGSLYIIHKDLEKSGIKWCFEVCEIGYNWYLPRIIVSDKKYLKEALEDANKRAYDIIEALCDLENDDMSVSLTLDTYVDDWTKEISMLMKDNAAFIGKIKEVCLSYSVNVDKTDKILRAITKIMKERKK